MPCDEVEGDLAKLDKLDSDTALRFEVMNTFEKDDPRRMWVLLGVIEDAVDAVVGQNCSVEGPFPTAHRETPYEATVRTALGEFCEWGRTRAGALLAAYVTAVGARG